MCIVYETNWQKCISNLSLAYNDSGINVYLFTVSILDKINRSLIYQGFIQHKMSINSMKYSIYNKVIINVNNDKIHKKNSKDSFTYFTTFWEVHMINK